MTKKKLRVLIKRRSSSVGSRPPELEEDLRLLPPLLLPSAKMEGNWSRLDPDIFPTPWLVEASVALGVGEGK